MISQWSISGGIGHIYLCQGRSQEVLRFSRVTFKVDWREKLTLWWNGQINTVVVATRTRHRTN